MATLAATVAIGCQPGPGPNEVATPAEAVIEFRDQQVVPDTMTVREGTEVTFRNEDDVAHQLAPGHPGDVPDDVVEQSNLIDPGLILVRVFPSAGEYLFHCRLHEGMTGVIEIIE